MNDGKCNVVWPERFRVEAMSDDEAEKWDRQIAEWDALVSDRPNIKRLLLELGALSPDELYFIQRVMFGTEAGYSGA